VPGGDCIIGSTAYSRDGKLLSAQGGNKLNDVYLWNGVTHKFLRTLTMPSGTQERPAVFAFSPDDKTLTAADFFGEIYQWDLATGHGSLVANLTLQVDASISNNLAISGDASTLAVTDNKGDGVDIINAATGAITTDLTDPDSAPLLGVNSPSGQFPDTALSLSADGSRLTVGDSTGNLYVWDVRGRKVIATLRYDPAGAGTNRDVAATMSGDGTLVAIPDGPGGVSDSLWDIASGANVTPRDTRWPHGTGATMIFSYGGQYIVTSESAYNHVDLWNALTRAHVASVDDSTLPVAGVSPDGKEILVEDGASDPYTWRFP
jgi:WD40 repeat protein